MTSNKETSEELEGRLKKYLAFLDDKQKQMKELEEDKTVDVDTKIKLMVKILNERMPE